MKLEKILELVRKNSLKLIFNPGQKNIKNDIEKVIDTIEKSHMLFVNKDEAIEIVDKIGEFANDSLNDEKFLAEKLLELGLGVVSITDGARGAWAYDGQNFSHVEARKEKVADTLGAGDAFASGFVAARLKGKNLEESLRWGISNSSSVVRFYGAIEGLLREEEIEK